MPIDLARRLLDEGLRSRNNDDDSTSHSRWARVQVRIS
jgi:hypothetical protein